MNELYPVPAGANGEDISIYTNAVIIADKRILLKLE